MRVALAVAVGEDQGVPVRGVQRGERAFKVEDSHVAGVGFGLAPFSPSGVWEAAGASALESGAVYGSLSEAQDGEDLI